MRRCMMILGVTALLAACSGGGDSAATLTPDEDRQLNAAADMLDANSVALTEVTDNTGSQP